ncbi:MAG: hypothetical protein DLM60_10415 [Pseudonocardiales bacterium]|nr:MAG: hypothetical protein DLM60_10415 [Pseudonocardiales bacterium]
MLAQPAAQATLAAPGQKPSAQAASTVLAQPWAQAVSAAPEQKPVAQVLAVAPVDHLRQRRS